MPAMSKLRVNDWVHIIKRDHVSNCAAVISAGQLTDSCRVSFSLFLLYTHAPPLLQRLGGTSHWRWPWCQFPPLMTEAVFKMEGTGKFINSIAVLSLLWDWMRNGLLLVLHMNPTLVVFYGYLHLISIIAEITHLCNRRLSQEAFPPFICRVAQTMACIWSYTNVHVHLWLQKSDRLTQGMMVHLFIHAII